WITRARRHSSRQQRVDLPQVVRSEMDADGRRVLLDPFAPLRTRNGNEVVPLCEHPGQGELGGRATFSRGDARDALDDREVPPEVVALEARVVPPPVVGREVVGRRVAAGQESAAERAVGDKADAQLATGGEQA